MNRRFLAVVAALVCLPAVADSDSVHFVNPQRGDSAPLEIAVHRSRIRQVWCHCTGEWARAPLVAVVSLNTRERYAEGSCTSGMSPAMDSKQTLPPRRPVVRGTHLGVEVLNSPIMQSAGVCTVTVKRMAHASP